MVGRLTEMTHLQQRQLSLTLCFCHYEDSFKSSLTPTESGVSFHRSISRLRVTEDDQPLLAQVSQTFLHCLSRFLKSGHWNVALLSLVQPQIVVGICCMMKKSKSKPMTQILERLCRFEYITVVIFPEDAILNEPVDKWPLCDCLISFHSKGTTHTYTKTYMHPQLIFRS